MDGEKVLLKETESYAIKNKKSEYKGTIQILKIKDDKVTFQINTEKTLYFYLINILLSAVLSLIFTMLIGTLFFERFKVEKNLPI